MLSGMRNSHKSAQLQIRVSPAQKSAIQRAAARTGMDMSAYVLSRLLSVPAGEFNESVAACAGSEAGFALAELNSLLSAYTAAELREAVATSPTAPLSPFLANYVAAMVELACGRRGLPPPAWATAIAPLPEPAFGTTLETLRLHLLTHSPAPFRRRNIFIDATLGDRV